MQCESLDCRGVNERTAVNALHAADAFLPYGYVQKRKKQPKRIYACTHMCVTYP